MTNSNSFSVLQDARVYVGTYAKYNSGSLFGAWLTLSDYSDYSDFIDACRELHSDEEDPEFMIQDYENVPRGFRSGYLGESLDPSFFDMLEELSELSEDEAEAVVAYWDEVDSSADIRDILDRYYGRWNSEEEYAEHIFTECYNIPDNLINYIDWSAVARDIFMDHHFTDGFVFGC